MHNKLFVVDNEIGLVGGRNIGDEDFQGAMTSSSATTTYRGRPDRQRDLDPLRRLLEQPDGDSNRSTRSRTFGTDLDDYRAVLAAHRAQMVHANASYMHALAANEPLAAMLSGKSSLVWAEAELVYDSPEKAKVEDGEWGGRLCGIASAKWRSKSTRN